MLKSLFCLLAVQNFVQMQHLTHDIYPVHYSIKLHPFIDFGNFSGQVSIHIKSNINQDKLVLHARNLNISEVNLNGKLVQNYTINNEYSELHIFESVYIGECFLKIKFNGSLFNNELGFGLIKEIYLINDLKDNSTRKSPIISSEFEPDHAREAFPCFDEPFFKSKFNVRLITPNETFRALSNMDPINTFKTSYGIVYDFATTVKMSTYLLGFAITDYEFEEKYINVNGQSILIRFNLHKPLGKRLPFDLVEKALSYYSNYTNINCNLGKIDFIEYDKTAQSLATENWGLITVQQGVIDEDCNTSSTCQITLVHELAHYWFGNLVTQDWWNGIWLSEGFATYFTIKALKQLDMDNPFLKLYFNLDDISSIQNDPFAVVADVGFQPEKAFNQNIYNKGAYILAILEDILSPEVFQKVIRTYLHRFAYKTSTINDFLQIIEEIEINSNIRYFLEGYLYQKSLPYLFVTKSGNQTYSVQQINKDGLFWQVPFKYGSDLVNTSEIIWLDRDQRSLPFDVKMDKWFILRPNNLGLYHVNYSPEIWDNLFNSFLELSIENQKSVLSAAFHGYVKKLINCDVFIKFIPKIKGNYGWWSFTRYLKADFGQDFNKEYQLYLDYLINILKKLDPKIDLLRSGPIKQHSNPMAEKCKTWISENLNKTIPQ